MEFVYNPQKTVQAAALFLKTRNAPMEYMKLLKLLYMADRMALDKLEQTITGDKYVSMDYGPVLSKLYNLISNGPKYGRDNPWFRYISAPVDYNVRLLSDPGDDELCQDEEDIIRTVCTYYGDIDVWTLSDITHYFPEWKDPHGSAIPIRIEDILRALGKSEADIDEIRKNAEKEYYIDLILQLYLSYRIYY